MVGPGENLLKMTARAVTVEVNAEYGCAVTLGCFGRLVLSHVISE
jgi:hypothetical protein